MTNIKLIKKRLVLGTALWGWGVTRKEACDLLDSFIEREGEIVDTATNYPINRCKDDLGLAVKWLADWRRSHPNTKLSLIIKVGAMDNMGGGETDLSPARLFDVTKKLRDIFEDSLACISVHWDNRCDECIEWDGVKETVEAMARIKESGLDVGLSGIKNPKLYYLANPGLSDEWIIQVKENVLTDNARLSYEKFFPNARYLAYGINMGGVKAEQLNEYNSVRLREIAVETSVIDRLKRVLHHDCNITPKPLTFNEMSLAFAYGNSSLSGVIIGPRNVRQLEETICYWSRLKEFDEFSEWFCRIKKTLKPG